MELFLSDGRPQFYDFFFSGRSQRLGAVAVADGICWSFVAFQRNEGVVNDLMPSLAFRHRPNGQVVIARFWWNDNFVLLSGEAMHKHAQVEIVTMLCRKLNLSNDSLVHQLLLSWYVVGDGKLPKFPAQQSWTTAIKSCVGGAIVTQKGVNATI